MARHRNLVRTAILAIFAAVVGAVWLNSVDGFAESPVAQTTPVTGTKKAPPVDPGQSFNGSLAELTPHETALAAALRKDVERLAGDIGERSMTKYAKLVEAAAFIEKSLGDDGFKVERQTYEVRGRKCATWKSKSKVQKRRQRSLSSAHITIALQRKGADDNGSGVAALLALGRAFGGKPTERTLRLVAFTNEEPPYFQEPGMGSLHYAKRCKERKENIVGMISVETIGYYTDAPDSQHYPPPLGMIYPSTGNFIAFRGQPAIRFARAGRRRFVPQAREVSLSMGRRAGVHPRRRLVRSLVVLGARLSGDHDHRHGPVPLPALSQSDRHARQARLSPHGPRRGRDRANGR